MPNRILFALCLLSLGTAVRGQIAVGIYGAFSPVSSANGSLPHRTGWGGGAVFQFGFQEDFRLLLGASYLLFEPLGSDANPTVAFRMYPLEAGFTYAPLHSLPVEPYLQASLGFYHLALETTGAEGGPTTQEQSDIGWGGGFGLRFPLTEALEADASVRYVYLPAEEGPRTLLPLQMGIVYRFLP